VSASKQSLYLYSVGYKHLFTRIENIGTLASRGNLTILEKMSATCIMIAISKVCTDERETIDTRKKKLLVQSQPSLSQSFLANNIHYILGYYLSEVCMLLLTLGSDLLLLCVFVYS
jgi:hypothetical protein